MYVCNFAPFSIEQPSRDVQFPPPSPERYLILHKADPEHMHTCTHAHMHTHTYTHTHIHTHTHTHAHTHMCERLKLHHNYNEAVHQ